MSLRGVVVHSRTLQCCFRDPLHLFLRVPLTSSVRRDLSNLTAHDQQHNALSPRIEGCKTRPDFSKTCSRSNHSSTSGKSNKVAGKTSASSSRPLRRDWLSFGKYQVYAWSLSGVETNVVLQTANDKSLSVAFDLGYATRPSVRCKNVFISHGHLDHVSGLFQHATKRNLYNWTPATYYVPSHLAEPLKLIGQQMYALTNTPAVLKQLDIRPAEVDSSIQISPKYKIRPFLTHHRVPSQGYLVYCQSLRAKAPYRHLSEEQLVALQADNQHLSVYDVDYVPEVAYTGDTTFELFLSDPPADLLRVKLLIMEATYLEGFSPGIVDKARQRGHTHLSEIIEHAHLFDGVGSLLLVHMSDKYSVQFALDALEYQLPEPLRHKVHIATLAKRRT